MKKSILICIILWPTLLLAQDNDFQIWYSLSSDVKIGDKWALQISDEIRTSCNASVFDKNVFDVGTEYEISKRLDAGIFFRYATVHPTLSGRTSNPEYYGTLQWGKKLDKIQLSARFRAGFSEDNNQLNGKEWEHRERLKLNYNLKGFPLNPVFSAEFFFPADRHFLDLSKTRILTGVTWKPGKENYHNFSLMYGWQHKYNTRVPANDFLLCFEYTYSFRKFEKK